MKYIRTAGGIYEVLEDFFKPMENNMVFIPQEGFTKILKQSDFIEELCDCFIKIKRKGNCKPYILKFDYKDLPTLKKQAIKYKDSPVYGAIHIEDKGLIYIAKMNEKGELELL